MPTQSIAGGLLAWRPPEAHFPRSVWFGVPTRRGGVSRGAFASLNFGLGVGDEREAVLENRARVFRALGVPDPEPIRVHQVHGRRIVRPGETPTEADGFLVRAGDPWVAVSAADCAPVALVSRDGSVGALVHSGWRGAREGIAASAVERLRGAGAAASGIRVAIGPCIHACCYPVGPEVAHGFSEEVLRPHPAGVALDLPLAIALGLRAAGVPEDALHVAEECTACRKESYFSHRRDRGITGRHWALLHLGT